MVAFPSLINFAKICSILSRIWKKQKIAHWTKWNKFHACQHLFLHTYAEFKMISLIIFASYEKLRDRLTWNLVPFLSFAVHAIIKRTPSLLSDCGFLPIDSCVWQPLPPFFTFIDGRIRFTKSISHLILIFWKSEK